MYEFNIDINVMVPEEKVAEAMKCLAKAQEDFRKKLNNFENEKDLSRRLRQRVKRSFRN